MENLYILGSTACFLSLLLRFRVVRAAVGALLQDVALWAELLCLRRVWQSCLWPAAPGNMGRPLHAKKIVCRHGFLLP